MDKKAKIMLQGDLRGADQLKKADQEIRNAYEKSGGNLVVDLSGLTCVDYDAVTALLAFRNEKPAGTLQIDNAPEAVERIISTFHIPF